jgi:hypothetical protein
MYRVMIQTGTIECADYEHTDHGVDLYDDGEFVAFVPYETLVAVVDESVEGTEDPSVV